VKRLLLDLNDFLDVILDRPPDADVAAAFYRRPLKRRKIIAYTDTTIPRTVTPDNTFNRAPFVGTSVDRISPP
jgi:hypothetical protein